MPFNLKDFTWNPSYRPTTQHPGAQTSHEPRNSALHSARDSARDALMQTCKNCGCDDCQALFDALENVDDTPTVTNNVSSDFVRSAPAISSDPDTQVRSAARLIRRPR
jgi:predicted neuraminidase